MQKIKLSEICHGRSGDKGDAANIGLIAFKKEDYELLKNLIEYFGTVRPHFSCREVIALLRVKPEWVTINQTVQRKGAL